MLSIYCKFTVKKKEDVTYPASNLCLSVIHIHTSVYFILLKKIIGVQPMISNFVIVIFSCSVNGFHLIYIRIHTFMQSSNLK